MESSYDRGYSALKAAGLYIINKPVVWAVDFARTIGVACITLENKFKKDASKLRILDEIESGEEISIK